MYIHFYRFRVIVYVDFCLIFSFSPLNSVLWTPPHDFKYFWKHALCKSGYSVCWKTVNFMKPANLVGENNIYLVWYWTNNYVISSMVGVFNCHWNIYLQYVWGPRASFCKSPLTTIFHFKLSSSAKRQSTDIKVDGIMLWSIVITEFLRSFMEGMKF